MKREQLIVEMNKQPTEIKYDDLQAALKVGYYSGPISTSKDDIGTMNLVICMEELAELQQQISKYLRDKGDYLGIVEEIADVKIALEWMTDIMCIDKDDINKAINVKLDRINGVIK